MLHSFSSSTYSWQRHLEPVHLAAETRAPRTSAAATPLPGHIAACRMVRVAGRPEPAGRSERGGTLAAADTEYTLVVRADETELGEAVAVVESVPRTGNQAEPHQSAEQQQVEAGRTSPASRQTACQPPGPR
jgi:hypothetical protein